MALDSSETIAFGYSGTMTGCLRGWVERQGVWVGRGGNAEGLKGWGVFFGVGHKLTDDYPGGTGGAGCIVFQ